MCEKYDFRLAKKLRTLFSTYLPILFGREVITPVLAKSTFLGCENVLPLTGVMTFEGFSSPNPTNDTRDYTPSRKATVFYDVVSLRCRNRHGIDLDG